MPSPQASFVFERPDAEARTIGERCSNLCSAGRKTGALQKVFCADSLASRPLCSPHFATNGEDKLATENREPGSRLANPIFPVVPDGPSAPSGLITGRSKNRRWSQRLFENAACGESVRSKLGAPQAPAGAAFENRSGAALEDQYGFWRRQSAKAMKLIAKPTSREHRKRRKTRRTTATAHSQSVSQHKLFPGNDIRAASA